MHLVIARHEFVRKVYILAFLIAIKRTTYHGGRTHTTRNLDIEADVLDERYILEREAIEHLSAVDLVPSVPEERELLEVENARAVFVAIQQERASPRGKLDSRRRIRCNDVTRGGIEVIRVEACAVQRRHKLSRTRNGPVVSAVFLATTKHDDIARGIRAKRKARRIDDASHRNTSTHGYGRATLLEKLGVVRVIWVGHPYVGAACRRDAGIARAGQALVLLVAHKTNTRVLCSGRLHDPSHVIGRGVVNADELPVRTRLSTDARYGIGQVSRHAIAGHDNGKEGAALARGRLVARAGHISRTAPCKPRRLRPCRRASARTGTGAAR